MEFNSVDEVTLRIKELYSNIETARDRIEIIDEWRKPFENEVLHGRLEIERLRNLRKRMEREMNK